MSADAATEVFGSIDDCRVGNLLGTSGRKEKYNSDARQIVSRTVKAHSLEEDISLRQ